MSTSLLKIFSLLASLSGSAVCMQITIPYPKINVTAGQNVTLYCTYTSISPIGQRLTIEWSLLEHYSQTIKNVYYLGSGMSGAIGNFQNRVTVATNPGNATMTITNMQPRDSGTYSVSINNPPDLSNSEGQIQLTVLVAPSSPHCSIKGAVDTGHYMSLACYSSTGMPRPTYTWNKVTDGVLSVTPPGMDYVNGVLIIGNLTKFEAGHYRCTASNYLGNATCEIDLNTGGEGGIIAAAIIAAILLAVIVFVVVWILVVKKKRKEKLAGTEMKSMAVANQAASPAAESLLAAPPEYADAREENATYTVPENSEMVVEETPNVA